MLASGWGTCKRIEPMQWEAKAILPPKLPETITRKNNCWRLPTLHSTPNPLSHLLFGPTHATVRHMAHHRRLVVQHLLLDGNHGCRKVGD